MVAKVRELLIKVNQTSVGYLTKEESGSGQKKYVFTYLPDIDPGQAVSVTMPVRKESYVTHFMHPIFEMSQPEGLLKDHLVSRFGKFLSMDDMGLLFLTGRSRIGNVTAELDPGNKDEELADVVKLVNNNNETDHLIEQDVMHANEDEWEKLFERLLEVFALNSGVGGMQPKVLADIVDQAPNSEARLTASSSTYIVKTSDKDYPFLAINESLCLSVADKAGLPVADYKISENGQAIIIDRFDINNDGTRLAFEDGCVLQAKPTRERYDSSMERLVESILTYIPSENQSEAARALFILTVVNSLVRNGDAHLKNFAITYNEKNDASFATSYDITTTRAYVSLRDDIPALMMHNTKRWPTLKELVRFGRESCLLKEKSCKEIIDKVIQTVVEVANTIPDIIHQYPGSEFICTAMVMQWNDAIKSLYFKKERDKKTIETGLDEIEQALVKQYGEPYQRQDKPVRTLRQENSLNM
jgi:serine/threonine-protein kinase HipA